jgi:hypothetical protein
LNTRDTAMQTVAGKMGLSRQTLFRKLKAEGVTFEKVLDDLRRQMAIHYMGEEKVSVNEGGLSPWILRTRCVFPRIQALDRI